MSLKFLRSNSKIIECHVVLLDNSQFVTTFGQKTVFGRELFDRVCQRVQVPADNKQHFGLQYLDREDGDVNWLNLDQEIHPPRKPKPLMYQFAVKVFPKDPLKFEHAMQWQILLQLKVLINRGKFSLSINQHAKIDGYYVQAALGDFIAKRHTPGYLEDLLGLFYCPPTGINCEGDISEENYELMVRDLHKIHRGLTREQAVSAALEVCKELPNYGVSLHYGGTDQFSGNDVVFCVSVQGMRICQLKSTLPEVGEVCHNFQWRDIISMICNNAKFYVYLTEAGAAKKEDMTCQIYRFNKGLYAYKAVQRLQVDADNHQKFFFEEDPERATIMRSLSLEAKSMNRIRSRRSGSAGSLIGSKMTLPFRRGTMA